MKKTSFSFFCCRFSLGGFRRWLASFTVGATVALYTQPVSSVAQSPEDRPPHVVVILADDMGIDSVNALNPASTVATPHIDRLIREGMTFSDAHSGSAVCSPTRYGVLTGRYSWRSRLKAGIVGKWERPLIAEDRLTLGGMLQERGYATACIGKWHLGWNWPKKGGGFTTKVAEVDFSAPTQGGPVDRGFHYYWGDDVPNWPPYVWIENAQPQGVPTAQMQADRSNGVSSGPSMPGWQFEDVLPTLAEKCVATLRERAAHDEPFFLFFPMTTPHTPINPSARFQGKSGVSKYADLLMETDWAVGEVLRALDESGAAANTLVIFTADNGTSPKCNFPQLESHDVLIRKNWRGMKADAFEGGHRVPFVVRWPGKVAPGTVSAETISLVDIMATVAEATGCPLPPEAAEDSVSLVPILMGKKQENPLHEAVVAHSSQGYFAVLTADWKAIFAYGSGGWSAPSEKAAKAQGLPAVQLYNRTTDPRETTNLQATYPGVVEDLRATLKRMVANGRSTPGPARKNDGPAHWSRLPWPAKAN